MLLKRSEILLFVLTVLSSYSGKTFATKLNLSTGFYTFSAKTSIGSGSLSNIGTYSVNLSKELFSKIEVGLGYNLVLSNTFSGDASFGFDIFAKYFPYTRAARLKVISDDYSWASNELFKPYVGGLFSQRQFQVVQASTYAGFGVFGGAEYSLNKVYSMDMSIRYISLGGPSKSSASFLDILVGVIFEF